MTGEPHQVLTERLDLRAVTLADLDALFAITSDPRTWSHHPEGRHTGPATTQAWIERAAAHWEVDGLGYWITRLRVTGEVIGIGGAQRQPGHWNLYYRLDRAHWGYGYATELSLTALRFAHQRDRHLPFLAWIQPHNTASRRVAERLGLRDHGVRPHPQDNLLTHVYGDRPPVI